MIFIFTAAVHKLPQQKTKIPRRILVCRSGNSNNSDNGKREEKEEEKHAENDEQTSRDEKADIGTVEHFKDGGDDSGRC